MEFAHFDQLQRQMWISDLEMVIRKRRPSLLLQFDRLNSIGETNGRKMERRKGERIKGGREGEEKEEDEGEKEEEVGEEAEEEESMRALLKMLEAERRALQDEETVRRMATRRAEMKKGGGGGEMRIRRKEMGVGNGMKFACKILRMLDEEVQRGEILQKTVHFLTGELEAERQQRIELENRQNRGGGREG